jgi:YD repeat-containing protein
MAMRTWRLWAGPIAGAWLVAGSAGPGWAAQTVSYEYDGLGRLTRAIYDGATAVTYVYDPSGNITQIEAGTTTAVPGDDTESVALHFAISPAAPSPFSGSTRIRYQVPATVPASIRIYDALGRLVRTLVEGTIEAGEHAAEWDGRTERGEAAPSGVYFYRVEAGGDQAVAPAVLLR